jgi:uncharacterized protein YuzE
MIRITYDAGVDALSVVFAKGKGRIRTQEVRAGVHLDFDADGRCVALELLDASFHVPRAALVKLAAPAALARTGETSKPRTPRRPK